MCLNTHLCHIYCACARITIKVANELTDKFFLNSAVTLTSKFQSQMINCLCFTNAWPDMHEIKAMLINWLIYFIYDVGH